jgi:mobilization protein MobC
MTSATTSRPAPNRPGFRSAAISAPSLTTRPAADRELLAQILVTFGQSRIAANINQLAYKANTGSWPESAALKQACDDIRTIRDTLISALGRTPPRDPAPAGP